MADALAVPRACEAADCGRTPVGEAAPAWREQRALDFMAKDYDSLLRLMLDALPAVAPQWRSRAEADLGMALLELFAYAGDQLSYLQDRIALEGFVRTATQFDSVRRLLRLVDYTPYPGHAASTWLAIESDAAAPFLLPAGFAASTRAPAVVFETTHDCIVYPGLSGIRLAAPAPSATNPREALLASIDTAMIGRGTRLLFASGRVREWVEVESAAIGATTTTLLLRQPLAHSYPVAPEPTVRGNAVHATHGSTHRQEERGTGLPGQAIELEEAPLTYVRDAQGEPRSTLRVAVDDERWTEVEDFVGSAPSDTHFCAARDNAGYVTVRFGDGRAGRRPRNGAKIQIVYRVGTGEAGRVAADTLTQFEDGRIRALSNPLAAADLREPESLSQARLLGPQRLAVQERAVVESDYEALAAAGAAAGGARIAPIQAKARFRWTGSWTTVFVSLDLPGRVPLAGTPGLREAFEATLAQKKLAGLDVRVEDARYAPLHIGLRVDVAQGFFARDVRKAVEAALVGGEPGSRSAPFFAPGRFRFGDPVYLSDLYAVAAGVPGVLAVSVTRFKRYGARHPDSEAQGFIPVGTLEVARCDNDAAHPENGIVYVRTCGGREG